MSVKPHTVDVYHVFLASPGDVNAERQHVRRFFDDYNRHTAHLWHAEFKVIDWENYSTIGVGRPQDLISQQTLEKFKHSLALVVGIMAQRFGTPTGKAESGTEEEFQWAKQTHDSTGFPEIKWFFRKVEKLEIPPDVDEATKALDQWKKVQAFRQRMQDLDDPIFYTEYPNTSDFGKIFDKDLNLWLNDPTRPWSGKIAESGRTSNAGALPAEFDSEGYRAAVKKRFDKVNFEMLDFSGAYYSGVRLWNVFVPQSARECHQYNPRLLEIPKEHQYRLIKAGEISEEELTDSEQAEEMRREYFQQPMRPVLEAVDQAFREGPSRSNHRLVILGDPGSGKSSLIRYLALRWSSITDRATRDSQPIPLVIDLGAYSRWSCSGRKDFVRFLEEAPVWHDWPPGLLNQLLGKPGRVSLLLDGLDEIFELAIREEVVNDIQRFSTEYPHTSIVVTSRVVGYQAQRLRDADFRHFMLQDLDSAQINAFIDRWHEQTFDDAAQAAPKRERLKKAISASKAIAMLAGNPLLLTMMAILNRNQELPRDRVDLYAQATRLLLHQWDTERALTAFPGLSTEIGWREKHDLLRRIASYMQSGPSGLKGNMIDGPTLTSLIEDYLRVDLHFPQSRAAARTVVEHLRQRNFILCFVGADSYGFVHRTFFEYFCAAELVHQFNIARTLDEANLLALFNKHCGDDEWREVLRLTCSQVDEQVAGRIIELLAMRTDLENWDGNASLPELPLAISCLSEVRAISRVEREAKVLLTKLIKVFVAGRRPDRQFIEELVLSTREVGDRWPGHQSIAFPPTINNNSHYYHGNWPVVVAVVTNDRNKVVNCALHGGWGVRRGALQVVVEQWPDESTRELLKSCAVEDQNGRPRQTALKSLAAKWPDASTRELLRTRAVVDQDAYVRSFALRSLAANWPEASTRELLVACAVAEGSMEVRSTAVEALAEHWPDASTRELLRTRAVDDQDGGVRSVALDSLAAKWPDAAMRELLCTRAVDDQDGSVRQVALELLAAKCPNESTNKFLRTRAVEDQDEEVRGSALVSVARKWPDASTRELLQTRAVEDQHADVRSKALESLAGQWPDAFAQELLRSRAVEDQDPDVRSAALESLAGQWPVASTAELLRSRAVEDQDMDVRRTALGVLAAIWPDESTRELLQTRAMKDPEGVSRSAALNSLVANWPDAATRELLRKRAVEDADGGARSAALNAMAAKWPDESARELLRTRAVEDPEGRPRSIALNSLAAKLPNESTRELLRTRAVKDSSPEVRGITLLSLAERWPDESTRELLCACAVDDQDVEVRSAVLESLASKWPDASTWELLRTRAVADQNMEVRGAALESLAEHSPDEITRELLRTRAVEDPDGRVRETADSLLRELNTVFHQWRVGSYMQLERIRWEAIASRIR